MVNAFLPCLLPRVMEEIALEIGTLVKNRRMLRNVQKDNTFVNPANLSDYLKSDYSAKFAEAQAASTAGTSPEITSCPGQL